MLRLHVRPLIRAGAVLLAAWAPPAVSAPATAQEPDSLPTPQEAAADTAAAAEDTLAPIFPSFPSPATSEPGLVQAWDLPDLLADASLSFADLLEYSPLLTAFRAGFLEGQHAAVFAGSGPGGFGYDLDGYRVAPLNGGALDLHLISLVELEQVGLIRGPGGYRALARSYRNPRREPYSRIEAGTGDRDVNLLRGFLSSGIGRTRVGFGFDRFDTRGQPGLEGSERNVVWASLARELPGAVWGQLEVRNVSSERDTFPSPGRTDYILRLRRPFGEGWHADLVAGYGTVESSPSDVFIGDPNTPTRRASAGQLALRGARAGEGWRAQLGVRLWDGRDVPEVEPEGSLELRAGPASLYASGRYSRWERFNLAAGYAALRLDLPLGLTATAEIEEGDDGIVGGEPLRWYEYGRWTAGGELEVLGWRVGARGGRWRVEPSPALGAPVDTAKALEGGSVGVVDAWAGGPLFQLFGGGVEVHGRYRERDAGAFYYWPQTDWQVRGEYRLRALNGQLGVWVIGRTGVRGSMFVPGNELDPGGGLGVVSTEDLAWFRGDLIVRIKDVHVFYNYEFFDAPSGPRDAPGFVLPRTRTHFGVKWEFWN